MKTGRPIYKKIFTRDFTLATVEIWVRPETTNPKLWTEKQQPYLPYIICERSEGRISAFYDPRGITWMKQLLIEHVERDAGFLDHISSEYRKGYEALRAVFSKETTLSREALAHFLSLAEKAWTWFKALWWIWELTPEEKKGVLFPKEIFVLRENTQDIVPEIERITRDSLHALYPALGDLIEVLSVEEIAKGTIPERILLEERYRGYFFVQNLLILGKDRAAIEDEYQVQFERLTPASKDEVKGQIAYKGIVKGKVKIVYGPKQMGKVEEGDIIVSPMTMPDVLPAMKKAAAFVTDEGGVMSHAAIIAREMKKPCIVGTQYATAVLKDGDVVEVDANSGTVRILEHAKSRN